MELPLTNRQFDLIHSALNQIPGYFDLEHKNELEAFFSFKSSQTPDDNRIDREKSCPAEAFPHQQPAQFATSHLTQTAIHRSQSVLNPSGVGYESPVAGMFGTLYCARVVRLLQLQPVC